MLAITFIGVGLGIGVQTWLIIRYLIDRMDKKMEKERGERIANESKVEDSLNHFRDNHVRRDDFHRHVDNVEKQIGNVVIMITSLGTKMDARLDSIVTMIANNLSSGKQNDKQP